MVNAIKLAAAIVEKLPKDAPLAGDDRGARGLRPSRRDLGRLVRGRAPLHRARLRERPARPSTSSSCAGSPREVAATDERCSIEVESFIQYRNMRDTLAAAPGDRREPRGGRPPRRARAEARPRSAAAPTARRSPRWACRRRTSSPAATTPTASASGSASRTWASRRRRSSSSRRSGPSSGRVASQAHGRIRPVPCPDGAAARHARPAARDAAHLDHRPLQLPLRLLHAEGGLRPRPRSSSSARSS